MHKEDFLKISNATDDVPWDRKGIPGLGKDSFKIPWDSMICNVAEENDRRLKSFEEIKKTALDQDSSFGTTGYIEERMFVEQWDYENNGIASKLLWTLIGHIPDIYDNVKNFNDVILVERTAAMVIQWLGTAIGSCFIDDVRRKSKEERENINDSIEMKRHKIKTKEDLEEMRERIKEEEKVRSDEKALGDYFKNQAEKKGIKRKKI